MKRHQLLDPLSRHNCQLSLEGGRHSIYLNTNNAEQAPVPRHAEIDNRLATKICQQLGIPRMK